MSLTPKILSFAVLMALGGAAAAANTDSPAVGRALGLLQSHGAAVRASANDQFVARDVIVDADGTEHVRFDRTYRGLPVIGGDMVVHSRGGQFKRPQPDPAHRARRPAPAPSSTPRTRSSRPAPSSAATSTARREPRLVVYARGAGAASLAYAGQFRRTGRPDGPTDMHYFVDAQNGKRARSLEQHRDRQARRRRQHLLRHDLGNRHRPVDLLGRRHHQHQHCGTSFQMRT